MAKNREEILALSKRRFIEVDGIRLQSLSEYELSTLESRWAKNFRDTGDIDPVMRSELLAICIVDEDGSRIFANNEVEQVQALGSHVTKPLYLAARKLCGLDDDGVAKAEKKSEETDA